MKNHPIDWYMIKQKNVRVMKNFFRIYLEFNIYQLEGTLLSLDSPLANTNI